MNLETSQPQRTSESHAASAALEIIDVYKELRLGREPVAILNGISLRIAHGEFAAIVGPSGSGKSTLLGIAAGLDRPTRGQVVVDGIDVSDMNEARLTEVRNKKIGMVFQSFNLIPTLTARENVEAPLYVGKHADDPTTRATELLDLVGLGDRLNNRPHQLSGGEQQRVAIARALAAHPALVFMDEPTGNLDRANGEKVLNLIQDLRRSTGTTFVVATHDPEVASAADRAINIVDGRVAEGA